MKKILAFLAVAALVATSQAVTVEWASGVITTPDGQANAGALKVSAMLYLIDSTTYTALDLSTEAAQQTALATYLDKTADVTGTSKKNGSANLTTELTETGIANSQYAVLIYQYGTGDSAVYKIGKGQDYVNDLGKQEKYASTGLAGQSDWLTKAASTPDDPVPEPTTVALLAIGLAAAGLKRKIA